MTLGEALARALFGPRDTSQDCPSCGSFDPCNLIDPCCIREALGRANKARKGKKEKPCTQE